MYSFLTDITAVAPEIYRNGWAEANAGNISLRLNKAELEDHAVFRETAPWRPLSVSVPEIAGEYFLVTASGCHLRRIADDPEHTCGVVRIGDDGESYQIVWGLQGGEPTSEFASHLLAHVVRRRVSGGEERAILHTHPTALIALCHVREFDTRSLTRLLWSMHQEGVCLSSGGVAYLPFQISGGDAIAEATCRAFETHGMVMWEYHGILASGTSLDHAFGMVQSAEKAALIYRDACCMGGMRRALDLESIRAVAENFHLAPAPDVLDEAPKSRQYQKISER